MVTAKKLLILVYIGSWVDIFLLHTEVQWLFQGKLLRHHVDLQAERAVSLTEYHFNLKEKLNYDYSDLGM